MVSVSPIHHHTPPHPQHSRSDGFLQLALHPCYFLVFIYVFLNQLKLEIKHVIVYVFVCFCFCSRVIFLPSLYDKS